MAYDNFKPQLWADNILENLDNSLVWCSRKQGL